MSNDIVQDGTEGDERPEIATVDVAALARESARVAAIRARIDAITNLPVANAGQHSVAFSVALARLGMLEVMPDQFAEFTDEARLAVEATRSALEELREAARRKEAEEYEREIQIRVQALAEVERHKQDRQQRGAMNVIRAIQNQGATTGTAERMLAEIDDIGARSISEEEFGLGAPMVKMAQSMALDALRLRYEQAVISEMGEVMGKAIDESFHAQSGVTARELTIAEAVRDAAFKAALDSEEGHEYAAITNLDLRAIIASVKEQA